MDGSVHIECTVLNVTEVDATNAELQIQICDQCKFAKEPSELTKLPGMRDNQRYLLLSHMQPFYDQYTQNVNAYVPWRYALIQALGFSTLGCFVTGYFVWAFNLI